MKNGYTYFFLFLLSLTFNGCRKDNNALILKEYIVLLEKGRSEYKYGKLEDSYITFLELLSKYDEKKSNKEIQRIYLIALNYLGEIVLKTGEKKLAYSEFERALGFAEIYGNEQYQIQAILNIVDLEDEPKKIEKILKATNEKFSINKTNKFSLDQIKYRLAILYANNNKIDESIKIFNDLLGDEYYKENLQIKSEFNKGIGIAYRNKKDFNKAIEYFDSAINLTEDSTFRQLNILVEKAEVYSISNQHDKFNRLFEQIKPSVDTIRDLNLKKRLVELQLNVSNQTNSIDEKIDVLSELLSLNEKIYKKSSTSLGSITVNLRNYELKKESEMHKTQNRYLKTLLLLATLLFGLGALLLFLFHRIYKKQAQLQLLEKEQSNKNLQNQIALESINAYTNGQEEERKQYAAILHDSLGANLAAVNMHLSLIKKDVPEQKYNRISGILKNVITETRNISHNIMPPLLVNQGVIAAITEKALEWNCPTLQFEVESSTEKVFLGDNLEIALYRGVLECMNNIIRSSEASQAKITFEQLENNTLNITITDNGKGFDVGIIERGEGGLGINGVKNRIKYFKGNFNIKSEIGKGTTVHISVPVLKMKQTA